MPYADVALGVDENGQLVAHLGLCGDGEISHITLVATDDSGPTATKQNGQLEYARTEVARVTAPAGDRVRVALGPTSMLKDGFDHKLRGWDPDESQASVGGEFTAAEVAALPAGHVISGGGVKTYAQWHEAPCAAAPRPSPTASDSSSR